MVDSFKVALAQPISGPSGGNTTIVHNEPTDLSWLKWLMIGVVVILAIVVGLFLFSRVSQDRGDVKAAQQRTRGVFSDCVERIQAISNSKFVSERSFNLSAAEGILSEATVTQLRTDLKKLAEYASSARGALNRFLPDQEKDPNPNGLSASAYQSNEQACTDMIVHFVEPAEELAKKIDDATNQAHTAPQAA